MLGKLFALQQLWDYVFIIQSSIEDWKTTPWRKVDVENMDIECKKFAKDIRLLDKEMRSWDTFVKLEATVKNMLTSLRAVGELQNPAIRERHWDQLMNSTKVSFIFCSLHSKTSKSFVISFTDPGRKCFLTVKPWLLWCAGMICSRLCTCSCSSRIHNIFNANKHQGFSNI